MQNGVIGNLIDQKRLNRGTGPLFTKFSFVARLVENARETNGLILGGCYGIKESSLFHLESLWNKFLYHITTLKTAAFSRALRLCNWQTPDNHALPCPPFSLQQHFSVSFVGRRGTSHTNVVKCHVKHMVTGQTRGKEFLRAGFTFSAMF